LVQFDDIETRECLNARRLNGFFFYGYHSRLHFELSYRCIGSKTTLGSRSPKTIRPGSRWSDNVRTRLSKSRKLPIRRILIMMNKKKSISLSPFSIPVIFLLFLRPSL